MDQIIQVIRSFDGVLELAPGPGSQFPEIAWGDHFFYDAPDGQVPEREQPFATFVTKDYPGDEFSVLHRDGRWRLNIHVGSAAFEELTGEAPGADPGTWDFAATDVVLPHPVYREQGWVSIVCPGGDTLELAATLLRAAHQNARRRAERRGRP